MSKAFAALLFLSITSAPLHAEPVDFTIVKVHLDAVQQPKNLLDGAVDCINAPACKAVLGTAAGSFGINPTLVSAGLAIIAGGRAPGSEETSLTYRLPDG